METGGKSRLKQSFAAKSKATQAKPSFSDLVTARPGQVARSFGPIEHLSCRRLSLAQQLHNLSRPQAPSPLLWLNCLATCLSSPEVLSCYTAATQLFPPLQPGGKVPKQACGPQQPTASQASYLQPSRLCNTETGQGRHHPGAIQQ